MTPLKYLEFKKDDFTASFISKGFSGIDAEEFFDIACAYIEQFTKVRSSESLTDQIKNELVEKSAFRIGSNNSKESDAYSLITMWITDAVWQDRSYYWAKIRLGQHQNRKSGNAIFDIMTEILSEAELFDLLKVEENSNSQISHTIIHSDKELRQIYDICNQAINCDYDTFRKSIETTNFTLMKIKRQNFIKDFTYRLSAVMDEQWYNDVCNTMNWRKSNCSGQRKKLEDDKATKNLNKLLPRPSRR